MNKLFIEHISSNGTLMGTFTSDNIENPTKALKMALDNNMSVKVGDIIRINMIGVKGDY